jgi:uncharacterized phage protein (TIGR02220 family)
VGAGSFYWRCSMRWYKHKTGSHDDPDISDAWDEFGDFGYAGFFVILELYGEEFNHVNDDGFVTISKTFLRRKLRKSWTKVELLLNFYLKNGRILSNINGSKVSIKVPNFIELSDNWTGRKLRSDSVVTTAIDIDKDKDIDIEERKEKKKDYTEEAQIVLDYLNEKLGTHIRKTKDIIARLKDGGTVDDCKKIIDRKIVDQHFINNPQYLHPDTLFRKAHWDKYLNAPVPKQSQHKPLVGRVDCQ